MVFFSSSGSFFPSTFQLFLIMICKEVIITTADGECWYCSLFQRPFEV